MTDRAALAGLIDAGLTLSEMAARAGCSAGTLRRAARRFGLPPSKPGRRPPQAVLADRGALAALIDSGLTTAEIAERTGRSTNVVRAWMTRHGLDYPQHRRRPAYEPPLEDADWLRREHHLRCRRLVRRVPSIEGARQGG